MKYIKLYDDVQWEFDDEEYIFDPTKYIYKHNDDNNAPYIIKVRKSDYNEFINLLNKFGFKKWGINHSYKPSYFNYFTLWSDYIYSINSHVNTKNPIIIPYKIIE